eukprot:TRINITY_DN13531_c0_g1_i1.p1 TRINITY_DN13531_c0_g1~~TRINITY_DN13531_c0_g1_i1.p1  ORF type:complete len:188 (-),score=44.38 TRINITY_DN13531_c0_g1_i1:80-643(-)
MSYGKLSEPSSEEFLQKQASASAFAQEVVVNLPVTVPSGQIYTAPIQSQEPASGWRSRCCRAMPLGRTREMMSFFFMNLFFGFAAFILSFCATNTHAGRQGAKMGYACRWMASGFFLLFMALSRHHQEFMQRVHLPLWAVITISAVLVVFGFIGFVVAARNYRRLRRAAAAEAGVHCGPAVEMQVVA